MNLYLNKIKNYLQRDKTMKPLICLFFLVTCFLLYFNALHNNFIFDDNYLIVDNPYIKNISLIGRLFTTDIFRLQQYRNSSLGLYYRPLQALSYSLDYFVWRLNPAGYRLTNILIHGLNCFLLFLLIYAIFKDKILALLTGIFFCLHPIQTSLVGFIAGRSNLLEMFFIFLSLLGFINYFRYQNRAHYLLSLLWFILALLSREGALLLPLFIILSALFLNIDKRRAIIYIIPYILIALFYLAFRAKFMPCDKFSLTDTFSLKRMSSFVWLVQDYIRQLILPVGFQAALIGKKLILKLVLLSVSWLIIIYSFIKATILKERIIIFASAFYLIGLLPIIKLTETIDYFGPLLSQHYVHLASIGFFLLLSYLILRLEIRFKKIAKICLIAIILIYWNLTMMENANYKDDQTFYKYVLSVEGDNPFIRLNLGNVYYAKNDYQQAIDQARLVLASEPRAWDAYLLLGNAFKAKGDLNASIRFYKKALVLNPRSSEAFNNLGLVYKARGNEQQAYRSFQQALELNPDSLPILKNLSDFFAEKKIYQEAIPLYERILRLDPADIDAGIKLGIIWAETGYLGKAEAMFNRVLRLEPDSLQALRNLAALYGNRQDFDEAILTWERILKISPDDKQAKENIKQARKIRGY